MVAFASIQLIPKSECKYFLKYMKLRGKLVHEPRVTIHPKLSSSHDKLPELTNESNFRKIGERGKSCYFMVEFILPSLRPLPPDLHRLVPEDDGGYGAHQQGGDVVPGEVHGELEDVGDEHGGDEDGVEEKAGQHEAA